MKWNKDIITSYIVIVIRIIILRQNNVLIVITRHFSQTVTHPQQCLFLFDFSVVVQWTSFESNEMLQWTSFDYETEMHSYLITHKAACFETVAFRLMCYSVLAVLLTWETVLSTKMIEDAMNEFWKTPPQIPPGVLWDWKEQQKTAQLEICDSRPSFRRRHMMIINQE